jgi:FKBP-type peptidyl-prolyl cis-trans isomerase SlpA
MSEKITLGKQVTLHFSLRLPSGEVVDSTFDKNPATCVMVDGSFLPGFEAALIGLVAGDKKTFTILPENGFGYQRDENIHHVPRAQFDPRVELIKGLMMDFADGKANLPGVIMDIFDDYVVVDFNHPLAGHELVFEVDIIDVVTVTQPTSAIKVVQL